MLFSHSWFMHAIINNFFPLSHLISKRKFPTKIVNVIFYVKLCFLSRKLEKRKLRTVFPLPSNFMSSKAKRIKAMFLMKKASSVNDFNLIHKFFISLHRFFGTWSKFSRPSLIDVIDEMCLIERAFHRERDNIAFWMFNHLFSLISQTNIWNFKQVKPVDIGTKNQSITTFPISVTFTPQSSLLSPSLSCSCYSAKFHLFNQVMFNYACKFSVLVWQVEIW